MTAHDRFGDALTIAHGFFCEQADDDLCDLLHQWPSVQDEYTALHTAALAVIERWDRGAMLDRHINALRAVLAADEVGR